MTTFSGTCFVILLSIPINTLSPISIESIMELDGATQQFSHNLVLPAIITFAVRRVLRPTSTLCPT